MELIETFQECLAWLENHASNRWFSRVFPWLGFSIAMINDQWVRMLVEARAWDIVGSTCERCFLVWLWNGQREKPSNYQEKPFTSIWGPHRFHRGQLPVTIRCFCTYFHCRVDLESQLNPKYWESNWNSRLMAFYGIHALFDRIGRFRQSSWVCLKMLGIFPMK